MFIVAGQQRVDVSCVLSSSWVWWSLPQFPPTCPPKPICWLGSCPLCVRLSVAGQVGAGSKGAAVPGHASSPQLGHCALLSAGGEVGGCAIVPAVARGRGNNG